MTPDQTGRRRSKEDEDDAKVLSDIDDRGVRFEAVFVGLTGVRSAQELS